MGPYEWQNRTTYWLWLIGQALAGTGDYMTPEGAACWAIACADAVLAALNAEPVTKDEAAE